MGTDQSWSCLSGVMMSHISPVHLAINSVKAECLTDVLLIFVLLLFLLSVCFAFFFVSLFPGFLICFCVCLL